MRHTRGFSTLVSSGLAYWAANRLAALRNPVPVAAQQSSRISLGACGLVARDPLIQCRVRTVAADDRNAHRLN